jgi:PAS domain S-box-containing protein
LRHPILLPLALTVPILWAAMVPLALAENESGEIANPSSRNVVAVVPRSWRPQYQLNSDGKPGGFAIEVLEEVALRAGLTVTYIVTETFSDGFDILRRGEADLIPNVGIIPERMVEFAFTAPVETFVLSLFVRSDSDNINSVDDLPGKKLAVVEKNVGQIMFGNRQDIDVHVYPDERSALFQLISGQVDALVYSQSPLQFLARDAGIEDRIKVVGEPLKEFKRGISVLKSNVALLATLDAAVQEFVPSAAYQRIYTKWYGRTAPFWTAARATWTMGVLTVLILVAMAGWRYQSVLAINRDLRKNLEDRFKTVVDSFPAKINIKDLEGRYLLINKEAETLFGVTHEEAIGKTPHEIFPEKLADAFSTHDLAVLETGQTIAEEEEWRREDGICTYLTVKFPLRDAGSRITAIGAIGTDITKRKQAERQSERLGRILDASFNEIYVFDAQTFRFTQVNQGARSNLGYTMQELSHMTPWDLDPAFDEESFGAMVEPLLRGEKEMLLCETEHRRKNGNIYPVEIRLQLSRIETPPVFIAIIADITERKQLEEALHDSMGKITAIVNTAVDGIITIDERGKVETFNAAAEQIFGYRAEDVIGRNINILMPEPYHSEHDGYLGAYLETGHAKIIGYGREVEGLRKDGSRFPMELAVSGMSVGGRRMFTGIVRDITERKQLEEALHDSMGKITAIVNTAVDGIITIDEHGKVETFNAAAEQIFGYRAEDVIGHNINILMPEPYHGEHDGYLGAYLETGHAKIIGYGREVEGLHKDGNRFPMELAVSGMSVGGRRMFTGIVRDITERKRAEEAVYAAKEAAEIANRVKSEFLATMSHELRTPLNAIIGFSEVMMSEIFGPVSSDKYREYANDIHVSGQHLLELINDILDISKVESGMDELHEEDVDIPVVADSVLRLVWQRAEKHGVKLNLEISDEPSGLRADNRKLKQILVNLLSNAIKFTEAGGEVTLKIWCDSDSGYIFQIVDTGIGMSPEDIPKALSQFGQIDSNLSRQYQGTGLGLPLTKGLVQLHGGHLDLQSQVGVGTTVTIRFPAARSIRSRHETHLLGVNVREAG